MLRSLFEMDRRRAQLLGITNFEAYLPQIDDLVQESFVSEPEIAEAEARQAAMEEPLPAETPPPEFLSPQAVGAIGGIEEQVGAEVLP